MSKKWLTRKQSLENGWMLTEGIGAILFYLIMIGVGAGILFFLFSSNKLTQMEQGLSTMTMQVQGLYAGSANYDGLNNALAVKAGIVPEKLLSGTTPTNPWGGAITFAPGTNKTTFTVKLASVPQTDCTKLASYQLDMWVSVDVNGSKFDKDSGIAAAANACTENSMITYTSR